MAGSSATINGGDFQLCPMIVTYKGLDLGGTKGGVSFSAKNKTADLVCDQFGSTPIDSVVSGQEYMVKFDLCEIANKDLWKVAFPHAKLIDGGMSGKNVYFDAQVGQHLLPLAGLLNLHPQALDITDLSQDYTVWKAVATSASEVKYGPEEQSVLTVEMRVYPDRSASPARFFLYGDASIGLVNASAAAAVAGANTGNGTVSGISVPASGIAETITLLAVHSATNAGLFQVSGSVSGALGNAIVGTPFISSKINLTINDGTTDFIIGDSFTIVVTGANYA